MPDSALDAIFKAYDVRGIYPDEIDESLARRIGNAFVAFTGAARGARRPRHAAVVGAAGRGVHRGRDARRAPTSSTSALASTDLCYFAAGTPRRARRRCSPPATTRPSTTAIKLCRAGAAPVGEDTGLAEIKAMVAGGLTRAGRGPGPGRARRPAPRLRARTCARSSTSTPSRRCGSSPTPPTAWAGSSCPRCSRACRSSSRCSTASSTARSRTTRPTRSSVENLKDLQRAVLDADADVGLAFDGDADRVFLVDDQGQPVSGSTTTAIVAAAILAPSPGRDGRAQPHLLEGRARGDPRARRHAGPHAASVTRSSSR